MQDASVGDERINWPERIALGPAGDAPRPPRRPRVISVVSWIVGLLMLPLSVLPFIAYTHFDRTGNLLLLRVERYFADPAAPELPPGEAAMYAATALHYRDALAVLALPEVIDGPGHPGALSPARFARHMRMLEAAGYHAVAPEQVVSWLDGKLVLPENAVLLTFDAARADVVLNAAPVLKDVEMRATVFPIGGAYEKNPVWFSSPEQLRELERRFGWSIGAFAAENHGEIAVEGGGSPYLSALEPGEDIDAFRARAREEYAGALRAADDIGTRAPIAYAWPYGAWGGDRRTNDPGVGPINLEEARQLFRLGFTLDAQESFRLLTRTDDPMRVARLAVAADWTPADLLERLNVAAAASAPVLDDATS